MNTVTTEEMKMIERMAASMMRDGVTAEMFSSDMDAFTKAYMAADIKKTEKMTIAYFSNPEFRSDVVQQVAILAATA